MLVFTWDCAQAILSVDVHSLSDLNESVTNFRVWSVVANTCAPMENANQNEFGVSECQSYELRNNQSDGDEIMCHAGRTLPSCQKNEKL